jgi:hypothetical protein
VTGADGLGSHARKRRGAGEDVSGSVKKRAGERVCTCVRGCAARREFVNTQACVGTGLPTGPAAAARATAASTWKSRSVLRQGGTRCTWRPRKVAPLARSRGPRVGTAQPSPCTGALGHAVVARQCVAQREKEPGGQGGRAGDARAGSTVAAPTRRASQPGSKAGITQHDGAEADKVTISSTRRPGFTEGRRDLSSPRWPRADTQASKKR